MDMMGTISKRLSFAIVICAVACAQGGAKAAQAPDPQPGKAAPIASAADLDGVISGIRDLEKRASSYTPAEWDFVLGYAHFAAARYEEAERRFAAASGRIQELSDYILYYRAACAVRLGRYSDAMAFLDELAAEFPDTALAEDALVERSMALTGMKRYGEAEAGLRRALGGARDSEAARIERLIAGNYVAMGDSEKAVDCVKRLAISAGSEQDLAALSELMSDVKKRFGVDVEKWLAAPSRQMALVRSFIGQSQWRDAGVRLENLLHGSKLDSDERIEAKWQLAKCYRWTHRYDEAIALIDELIKNPSGPGVNGIESTLAMIYAKKNEFEKARAIRQRMLERFPAGSRAAAEIAFKIAFLYFDEGRYDEAIKRWETVAAMRGAGSTASLARWYIAWSHMMKGNNSTALAVLDDMLKSRGSGIDDRIKYWKGRLLQSMGRESESREAFKEVIQKHPKGYYAELSRRRLAERSVGERDIVRADGNWPTAGDWKPGQVSSDGCPHMARALVFDRLGLHDAVGRELRAIDLKRHPHLALPAMWLARRNFAHDFSYRMASNGAYKEILSRPPGGDPFARFVWEQSYPSAYEPVVERYARISGVDPLLVWSVMKNESTFKPQVVSPAGAVGLMQLMPTTAQRLAGDAGVDGHSRLDLYDPATNIAYGVTYLGKLSNMFDGNAVAMIASYNAGEEAVGRWRANSRAKDIEGWIEEIPYAETNLYVKKVLNSYWNYQRLYGDQPIANIGPRQ